MGVENNEEFARRVGEGKANKIFIFKSVFHSPTRGEIKWLI